MAHSNQGLTDESTEEPTGEPGTENDTPGARLRAIRKANGWTLAQLGHAVGRTHSNLSKIENGQLPAQQPLAGDIARALGLDEDQVIAQVFGTDAVLISKDGQ